MPYVIFFKKVNKRSIINYENENFPKYLLDFKEKLTMDKNVRVSYGRKNNMSAIHDMKAQLNGLESLIKQFIEGNKGQGQVGNVATPVAGISMEDPSVAAFYEGFTKYLQDAGFISKKPLDKRDTDKGDAAPTPDETPASVKGPVTVLYGLRKLKEKIADANFVIENLPNASAVAAAPNVQVPGNAVNDTWGVNDVNTVKNEYKKLSEVVKELKSLMSSLTLSI